MLKRTPIYETLTFEQKTRLREYLVSIGFPLHAPVLPKRRTAGKPKWDKNGRIPGMSFEQHMAMLRAMDYEDQIERLKAMKFKTGSIKARMIRTLKNAIARRDQGR